jgi:hypothetical protein
VTKLIQTAPGVTSTVISDALAFQLEAYVGPRFSDGNAIDNVDMRILGPGGTQVYQKTEEGPDYCAFGGNGPCTVWDFAAHNYEWPSGQLIQNGAHTLRAIVNTTDGRSQTINIPIQIQLPIVTNLAQTAPNTTTTVISDALVLQLEVYVGPRFSDGHNISLVDMRILNSEEVQVHQNIDNKIKYCAFGGGSPNCNVWVFADHDNKWPDGQPINAGLYTLQAIVQTTDGRSQIINNTFQIRFGAAASGLSVYLPLMVK